MVKSKAEADTFHVQNDTSSLNIDKDQVTRGLMERMRVVDAEMGSRRWNETSIEEITLTVL